LTIRGFFSPVSLSPLAPTPRLPIPYVRITVELPLFRSRALLNLMVDTGADSTVLYPHHGRLLIPDAGWATLRNPVRFSGGADHFPEPAVLHFSHEDGRVQSLDVPVLIAAPDASNERLESVLGRDLLAYFTTLFDPRNGALTLD
jgi:hypothetical protein